MSRCGSFAGSRWGFSCCGVERLAAVVFVAVVLVGLGLGAELDVMPYMVSRYFGLRAFGEIYSYAFAAFTLGGVIGPPAHGSRLRCHGVVQSGAGDVCDGSPDGRGVDDSTGAVSGLGGNRRAGSRSWRFKCLRERRREKSAKDH